MKDILIRLREMSTQMGDQGELLAAIGSQVDGVITQVGGINNRLDILNGRVARGENRISALETDKAVADGRAKLAGWLWSIVGAGVVIVLETIVPKILK